MLRAGCFALPGVFGLGRIVCVLVTIHTGSTRRVGYPERPDAFNAPAR